MPTDSVPTGLLLVDKESGMTSHDVVARARRVLGTRKVGHAGTLDPMATGLLILGVGTATRLLTYLVGLGKTYEATIRLGESTTTDDAEGETVAVADASGVARAAIQAGIAALTGEIDQVPSTVSAIKVDGRRAYDRVRAGETVELAPRRVAISRFELLDERREGQTVDLDVAVDCSSGTYIRALARDLGTGLLVDGRALGGHLTALRRTAVGPFSVSEALPIASTSLVAPAAIASRLFPVADLDGAQYDDLTHGRRIELELPDAPVVAALAPDGRLAGLVGLRGGTARVLANFPVGMPA